MKSVKNKQDKDLSFWSCAAVSVFLFAPLGA